MLLTALWLTATGCWYEAPIDTAIDYPEAFALTGEVVVADGPDVLGPAMVLLYDATDPPLPNGFGRPVDFAVVPDTAWGGDAAGLRSGPWGLNGVAPGDYLLTTLVDHDEDFSPFWDFMGSATCGDQLGAWVEGLSSTSPAVLSLTEARMEEQSAVTDLAVVALTPLTLERPAFSVAGFSVLDLTAPTEPPEAVGALSRSPAATDVQLITLQSVGVDHELLTINGPDEAECPAAFPVTLADLDGDGAADLNSIPEAAAIGAAEVSWPRVYMSYIADFDGNAPADGEGWITQPLVYVPYNPDIPPNVPQLTDSLTLVFSPIALHTTTDAAGVETQEQVADDALPAGIWATVVVNPTGQVWILPNQLGGDDGALEAAGFEVDLTQSASAGVLLQ